MRPGPEPGGPVPEWILARTADVLRRLAPSAPAEVSPGHLLLDDLGFDSLALVKTVVAVEDAFGIELPEHRLHELRTATVLDLARLIEQAGAAA